MYAGHVVGHRRTLAAMEQSGIRSLSAQAARSSRVLPDRRVAHAFALESALRRGSPKRCGGLRIKYREARSSLKRLGHPSELRTLPRFQNDDRIVPSRKGSRKENSLDRSWRATASICSFVNRHRSPVRASVSTFRRYKDHATGRQKRKSASQAPILLVSLS
jgi:hypothetical protein